MAGVPDAPEAGRLDPPPVGLPQVSDFIENIRDKSSFLARAGVEIIPAWHGPYCPRGPVNWGKLEHGSGTAPPFFAPLGGFPQIDNRAQMMSFSDDFLKRMEMFWGGPGCGALEYLARKMRKMTVSSAFSGIDAPAVGDSMLCARLAELTAEPVKEMKYLHACEIDPECQAELMRLPNPPEIIYGDLEDFFAPEVYKSINKRRLEGHDVTWEDLLLTIKGGRAIVPEGYAINHRRRIKIEHTELHRAGLTCHAWAGFGKHDGTSGKSMVHIASWFAIRRYTEDTIIIVEEAEKFNTKLLDDGLGDLYVIETCVLDPQLFGVPARRPRCWAICYHRGLVECVVGNIKNIIPLFCRQVRNITYRSFMIAGEMFPSELEMELQWSLSRKNSRLHGLGGSGNRVNTLEFRFGVGVLGI